MAMRKESASGRAAWTAHVEGGESAPKLSKYRNTKCEYNGKTYDSQREAGWAALLQGLAWAGKIRDYEEQKRITLVPGDGKIRPIVYMADFYYVDLDGTPHVLDAKGFKTPVYRLKKKLAALLLRIEIEEV